MFTMDQSSISQSGKSAPDKIVVSLNESATKPKYMETTEKTNTTQKHQHNSASVPEQGETNRTELAAAIRPANKFQRVGMSFVERIEAKVRAAIREEVRIHPSKGKTLL